MGELEEYVQQTFEGIKVTDDEGQEFWSGRELMNLLGYSDWRNFLNVIGKAKEAAEQSGQVVDNHFVEVTKMVSIGYGNPRPTQDFQLSRYACYLIAQNGDPTKFQIAQAQTYFAVQTRKQEVDVDRQEQLERITARHKLSQTEKEFASEVMHRDVDGVGVAQIKSRGDQKLFTVHTNEMKRRLNVPKNRPLADFLPTVSLKAKDLASEMTTFNTKKSDLQGLNQIAVEHEQNNSKVREVLVKRGIRPEFLKPEEDVRKVERRLKKETNKLEPKKRREIS